MAARHNGEWQQFSAKNQQTIADHIRKGILKGKENFFP